MIKVGIAGGESFAAGELLRILVLHPEVELVNVWAPPLKGRAVGSVHKGLIGDTDIRFSDSLNLGELDFLFVTSPSSLESLKVSIPEDLKIVIMEQGLPFRAPAIFDNIEFVPGVSEMFRKPLVRSAKGARILPSPVAIALIALFPLALHLMLNDSLVVRFKLPTYRKFNLSPELIEKEIVDLLQPVQLSFQKVKEVELENSGLLRALEVEIELASKVSEEEIVRIFNDVYDDHNFTFITSRMPEPTEVGGTHKCLLNISKPEEGKLLIKAVADSFMRGGTGDAIHAMNLMSGLYEKTGLSFPASMAFRDIEISPSEL